MTNDGSLLAYATSEAGSDWKTWRVRDVATGADRPDVVEWSKYGDAAWRADKSGFYYSAVDKPGEGDEYTEQVGLVRIFFHSLGTPQADDQLVFEAPDEPEWIPQVEVSEDGRFVIISISRGTNPEARIEVFDLYEPGRGLVPLVSDFSSKAVVVNTVGTTFFLVTDDRAERGRLVAADLDHPEREAWQEVVGEREALLLGARNCGGRLVCHHLQDACSRLSVFELDGTLVRELPLPPVVSLNFVHGQSGIEGRADSSLMHFGLRSFTDSGSLWSHDVDSGETRLLRPSAAPINADDLVSEQVFVTADDGVPVPLFLTYQARHLQDRGRARPARWLWRLRHIHHPGLHESGRIVCRTGRDPGRRGVAGRGRVRALLARRRPAGAQATGVRRLLRLRPVAGFVGMVATGPHRHKRCLQRWLARWRLPDPAPGAVRRRRTRGGGHGHAPVPQVHHWLGLEERLW